jgi:hypothetical protein
LLLYLEFSIYFITIVIRKGGREEEKDEEEEEEKELCGFADSFGLGYY